MGLKKEKKRLNFGCGKDIRPGWDSCDIQKSKGIINFDFNKFPYPLKDDIYDYILMEQTLHLLEKPERVIEELYRISKNKAEIKLVIPYYNNKGATRDILTKHYFSDSTFEELIEQSNSIDKKDKFEIIELVLVPTIIGKFIPKTLREKLSLFFGGIVSQIHIKLRVIKREL